MKIDLSILNQRPEKDMQVILSIDPLAPLSIVSTFPGSYYKSQNVPTKANLCGIFENVMGWHLGKKERSAIHKETKKFYKKKFKINEIEKTQSAVGYTSLIGHLFDIELPHFYPPIDCRYDDLWTQQMKHNDKRHMDGTANLSWQVIQDKSWLKKELKAIDDNDKFDKKEKKNLKDKLINDFVANNLERLPMYYTSPTAREFIIVNQPYQIKLLINEHLFNMLNDCFEEYNIAYLGTNEGWVDLSIKEL